MEFTIRVLGGTHGSVVIGVKPVTERPLVQTLLWSLDAVCCALKTRHIIYIVSIHSAEFGYWLMP